MPIYQYDCNGCKKRVEVFFRTVAKAEAATPACPECGSKKLKRAVSLFARRKTAAQRLEDIDINQELGRLEGIDEGSYTHWAERMGREYDGLLGSENTFSETAKKAYAGEDPLERLDPRHVLEHRISRAKERLYGAPEPVERPADIPPGYEDYMQME